MKISILEFDDPGASDDEPVKGVTMGDIRAWHDSYVELEADAHRLREALEEILFGVDPDEMRRAAAVALRKIDTEIS